MNQVKLTVTSNRALTKDVYEMILTGDISEITRPGQFVNIKLDGMYLRRPISVCDWDAAEGKLTIIYKVVGKGTEYMAALGAGAVLDVLTGLGNGFDTAKSGDAPVVIGGGVGVPPMYGLAKRLIAEGKKVTAILGFNTASEIFYEEEFKKLGCETVVTTVDGSRGVKGFVTAVLSEIDSTFFYTCGPAPMLKAVYDTSKTDGQLSFEERMGCGFGACMGCSCKTKYGSLRICKDGPVLDKEVVVW